MEREQYGGGKGKFGPPGQAHTNPLEHFKHTNFTYLPVDTNVRDVSLA